MTPTPPGPPRTEDDLPVRRRRRGATRARFLRLPTIQLAQDERVLTASLHLAPPQFVGTALLRDLDQLTRAVDRDPSVGAVILASATDGRFLTHADADELGALARLPLPHIPDRLMRPLWRVTTTLLGLPGAARLALRCGPLGRGMLWGHRWHRTVLRMNRSGAVYLAATAGPTLGGGHEIALACDFRIAADSPDVTLGQIEILAGLIPGGGGTQRLPRLIGTGRALEVILDGAPLPPQRALELGLVHRVVAGGHLMSETHEMARRLSRRSRTAVRLAKRRTYEATDHPLRVGLHREMASFLTTGTTPWVRSAFEHFAADRGRLGDSPFVAAPDAWHAGTRHRE